MSQPNDQRLSTLTRALSPEAFQLVHAACSLTPHFIASDSHAVLVKHVPGKRATIMYNFDHQTEAPKRIIGKLYRSGRRAARMQRWLTALNNDVFSHDEHLGVPQPIGLSDELRMVLHEYIEGDDLRHALDEAAHEPFALAARWLARLHSARPLDELKVRTVEHEIETSLRWLDAVQPHVSPEIQAQLIRARDRLSARLAAPPPAQLCAIHRDYYYANLLWDGERLWAIDLDQLRIGDPALDVAHFLAHLQVLAYRQTGDFAAYDPHGERFLTTYHDERPAAAIDARLPLYRAYTFLKLAATETQRARLGWRQAAEAFATRACAELDLLA